MSDREAYHIIEELLFNLWYINSDKENYNEKVVKALDKFDTLIRMIERIESILVNKKPD